MDIFLPLTTLISTVSLMVLLVLHKRIDLLDRKIDKFIIEKEADLITERTQHYKERKDLYNRISSKNTSEYLALSGEKPKKAGNFLEQSLRKARESNE